MPVRASVSVDRVGRRQELARRLAPEHVFGAGAEDLVGRIRLPTLELAHSDRPLEACHRVSHVCGQPILVEPQRPGHLAGPGQGGLPVEDYRRLMRAGRG